jgi:predicted nucleic-acid-binding protein
VIAFDTNVLVRLLVGDDPDQLARAERLLLQAKENDETCFLSAPVLCELEWVLESSYGAPRADILAVLRDLLDQEVFAFEDRQVVRRAIDAYQHGRGGFSDYLIGSNAQAHGARVTYTFDRDLRRAEGFLTPD